MKVWIYTIVPYIWNEAYNYYLNLYKAQTANADVDIAAAASQEKTVTIKLKLKEIKKKLFHFEEDES